MDVSPPDPAPCPQRPDGAGPGSGVRIYAQLKPDGAAVSRLLRLQAAVRQLSPRSRAVTPERLHLTLIHFGKADEAFTRLRSATGLGPESYGRALTRYLGATAAALPGEEFVLVPLGLAGFGREGSTLAVEFAPDAGLQAVHSELYGLLLEFLAACGVPDPAGYAARDPALEFAAVLHPHISILHGFRSAAGALPAVDPEPMRLRALPVLYRT